MAADVMQMARMKKTISTITFISGASKAERSITHSRLLQNRITYNDSQNSISPYAMTPKLERHSKSTQQIRIQVHCGTVSVQCPITRDIELYSLARTVTQRYQYAHPRANASESARKRSAYSVNDPVTGNDRGYLSLRLHYIEITISTRQKLIRIPAGPPEWRALPEPTSNPGPMIPPITIIFKFLDFSFLFRGAERGSAASTESASYWLASCDARRRNLFAVV